MLGRHVGGLGPSGTERVVGPQQPRPLALRRRTRTAGAGLSELIDAGRAGDGTDTLREAMALVPGSDVRRFQVSRVGSGGKRAVAAILGGRPLESNS